VDALTYGRGGGAARKNDLAEIPTDLDEYFFKLAGADAALDPGLRPP
jgi:hypothetical protein